MKLSKLQIFTAVAFLAYGIFCIAEYFWEQRQPADGGAVIRVDYIIILPILIILLIASVIQYFMRSRKN